MILYNGKYYIYRHVRLDKNEPFYIGMGTKCKNCKISEYFRSNVIDRNIIWKRIVNKTKYKVEILLESDDYEFIKEKEKEFIKLYGRIDLKTGILSNMTDGGDGNHSWSKERKISHSNRIKEEIKNGKRVIQKPWSGAFGKNSPVSKPILKLHKITEEIIEEFECAREAFRKYGYLPTNLVRVLKQNRQTAYGFKWKYKNN